jgi:hypothetical protein
MPMNLADLIEKRRYLGREFLVWLWFESEIMEGRFDIAGYGPCEIFLEGQLSLTQDKEAARLKGAAPSASVEAHEALRQGKLPAQARVRLARGELEFGFVFTAETVAISGVKIPKVVREEGDEQFYERMYLVEDLEGMLGALYARFLGQRLTSAWDTVLPLMQAWVRGEAVDPAAYRRLAARIAPIGRAVPTKTAPPPAGEERSEAVGRRVA